MKAMNDYVIVEQQIQQFSSIVMKENNMGVVISCLCDRSLVGKTIIFSNEKRIQEYDGYKFVPYDKVMAVIEGDE
jgi:hypothetical protein